MRSLVGGQDRAYSFRKARNREDAAQRLNGSRIEETFHRRFVVLALECPRASPLIIYLLNK
jgi:hypothetical protein